MNYISMDAIQREMTDIHVVHAACLLWRMRCLSHRLIEFGWEESVKHLQPVEAICLAAIVPPVMHDALVEAAYAVADDRWRSFIERNVPRFATERAS